MEKSDSIKEIALAMVKFQIEVDNIAKTDENPFFKSKYAPLPEILKVIKKPLSDNGLSFMQFPKGENELETIVMHTSGEWIKESYYMKPVKGDPQAFGSVITYQRRYALGAILGLSTEEDDDANKTSEPKQDKDKRPWLSKKAVEEALDNIRRRKFSEGMDGREYVDKLIEQCRMKKEYKDQLLGELNEPLNEALDDNPLPF